MRKILGVVLAAMLVLTLTGCAWSDPQSVENDGIFRISMVPDMGGVNDQSFNQSALEGLYEMRDNIPNVQVSYAEPKQFLDFEPILETLADGPSDMILCVGNVLADAAETVASRNRDKTFVNVDVTFDEGAGENLTGIIFKAQDAAFQVGYAAGLTTKTNKVGFVGGMRGPIITSSNMATWRAWTLLRRSAAFRLKLSSNMRRASRTALRARRLRRGCTLVAAM